MDDVAVFSNIQRARAAADAAMPRRKHNRPYVQSSGWHWARSVACPTCGAPENVDCPENLHRERENAARGLRGAADRWIVAAYPNLVLLTDGRMFDTYRKVTVRA